MAEPGRMLVAAASRGASITYLGASSLHARSCASDIRPLRRTNDTGRSRYRRSSGFAGRDAAAGSGTHPGYPALARVSPADPNRRPTRRLWRRDEVDQLLDPAEKRRLEIAIRLHRPEDALPCPGEIRLVASRPAEGAAHADLELDAAGNHGPALDAHRAGRDALPHVDPWMSDDQHMRAVPATADRLGDAGLLRSRYEVVDEHAVAAGRRRRLLVERGLEEIDSLQVLDDDALGAQVVAPHLLDQLGIVASL